MVGFGNCLTAATLLIVSTLAAHAEPRAHQGQTSQPAPQPAQIDRNGVLILVRTTLLALQQANETGNYTVLRDLAAPSFRDNNTAARLGEIFASQRAQKLDVSGVSVLDPQFTVLPQIEPNGFLRMAGFFPSVPSQLNFELIFSPHEGRWRIFGISISLGSSIPTPPVQPLQTLIPAAKADDPPKDAKASSKTGAVK